MSRPVASVLPVTRRLLLAACLGLAVAGAQAQTALDTIT